MLNSLSSYQLHFVSVLKIPCVLSARSQLFTFSRTPNPRWPQRRTVNARGSLQPVKSVMTFTFFLLLVVYKGKSKYLANILFCYYPTTYFAYTYTYIVTEDQIFSVRNFFRAIVVLLQAFRNSSNVLLYTTTAQSFNLFAKVV